MTGCIRNGSNVSSLIKRPISLVHIVCNFLAPLTDVQLKKLLLAVQRSPVCKTRCEPSPCLRQLGDHPREIGTALIIVRQTGHPSLQQILSVVILTAAGAVRPLPEFIIKIELKKKVRRV